MRKIPRLSEVFSIREGVDPKKVVYSGFFLDEPSHRKLMELAVDLAGWTPVAHHVTLWFKPPPQVVQASEALIGQEDRVSVSGVFQDEKAIAVRIAGLDRALQAGAIDEKQKTNLHVTVATAPGVKPVYSNELIKAAPARQIQMDLTGKYGFFVGNAVYYGG